MEVLRCPRQNREKLRVPLDHPDLRHRGRINYPLSLLGRSQSKRAAARPGIQTAMISPNTVMESRCGYVSLFQTMKQYFLPAGIYIIIVLFRIIQFFILWSSSLLAEVLVAVAVKGVKQLQFLLWGTEIYNTAMNNFTKQSYILIIYIKVFYIHAQGKKSL